LGLYPGDLRAPHAALQSLTHGRGNARCVPLDASVALGAYNVLDLNESSIMPRTSFALGATPPILEDYVRLMSARRRHAPVKRPNPVHYEHRDVRALELRTLQRADIP